MDYNKLPKIDVKDFEKKELHKIFHTNININKVSNTSRDNLILTHSILIDDTSYITGKSQLLVLNEEKKIYWLQFHPFSYVKQESEIISDNMTRSELEHNISIYKNTMDNNPEMFDEYRIISKTIDKKIEPIALIKNYWRQGLGSIANFRILESIINNYDTRILNYKVRHDGPVSPYRKEQLSKIGIMAFEKHNPLVKLLDIDVSETVKEYYVKSGQYAVKKGLL
jgi:hypothetical protein